jgi:hypothetical protein
VFATDTAGDLATDSNLTFSDADGLSLFDGNFTVGTNGAVTLASGLTQSVGVFAVDTDGDVTADTITAASGAFTVDGSGNTAANSLSIALASPITNFTFGTTNFASAGSVSVADTSITNSSVIVVTEVTATPLAEEFSVVANAGVGFTIYSTNAVSTATVNYIRVN